MNCSSRQKKSAVVFVRNMRKVYAMIVQHFQKILCAAKWKSAKKYHSA